MQEWRSLLCPHLTHQSGPRQQSDDGGHIKVVAPGRPNVTAVPDDVTVFLKQTIVPLTFRMCYSFGDEKRILQKHTSVSSLSDLEYCCYVNTVF